MTEFTPDYSSRSALAKSYSDYAVALRAQAERIDDAIYKALLIEQADEATATAQGIENHHG